jgi:hypothetical protein
MVYNLRCLKQQHKMSFIYYSQLFQLVVNYDDYIMT